MKPKHISTIFFLTLNVLLLAIVLLASSGLVKNKKISLPHPQAASGCITRDGIKLCAGNGHLNGSNFTGDYTLENLLDIDNEITVSQESYWCADHKVAGGSCGDHSWVGEESFSFTPHQVKDFSLDADNGTGNCGSFQIDAFIDANPVWHYDGYSDDCNVPTQRPTQVPTVSPGGPTVTRAPTASPTPPRLACNATCDPSHNNCSQLCPLCLSNGTTTTCQPVVACNQSCVNSSQCPQNCAVCTGPVGQKTCRPPAPTVTPSPTPLVCGAPCNPSSNRCPVGCSMCVGSSGNAHCVAPTPTTAQVTAYITQIPLPSLSKKANENPQGRASQKWVCLEALPCTKSDSHCPAVADLSHKAKILSKSNSWEKSTPNKSVYIYECLKTATGIKCTSGDGNRDMQTTGYNNLPYLMAAPYHYRDQKLFQANGVTNQSQPVRSDANGNVGPFIWESQTDQTVEHLFYAMNELTAEESAFIGAQQQSDINSPLGTATNCKIIKWDPYGRVLDNKTGEPIQNATLTLLKKNAQGIFVPLKEDEVIGGVTNPYLTAQNGEFDFTVPDGVYKLEIQSENHVFISDKGKIDVKNIDEGSAWYAGQEIVIKGSRKQFTIFMERKPSLLEQLNDSLKKFLHL